MLDIKFLVENLNEVKANLSQRKFDVSILDEVVMLNQKRKETTTKVENARAEIKKLSQEIGQLKKTGGDASTLTSKVNQIKEAITQDEILLDKTQEELNYHLSVIPNVLSSETPKGQTEEDNVEAFKWGVVPTFKFTPKDHVELGEKLGMLDFETAGKITGSRFVVYKHHLARLERAVANFMLDSHTSHGYIETITPLMVHSKSLYGTGQLPKFKEDLFKLEGLDYYLIPTSEVPVTNYVREQILNGKDLPLKYTAHTPCFRSEAGSYGKDTKGLIRLHQFNKVELVNITRKEDSVKAHEEMIKRACFILESLKLPYRALTLCSADIGFSSQKTIDLEVWLPGQNKYREISSISNCGDFQARRAEIRYRDEAGKIQFAHTLNGSGLAVGRTIVAIMENYQQEDGSIKVPEVLKGYMGGVEVIK